MSFNSYQNVTPEMEARMRQIATSVYDEKKMTTVWFNPVKEQYFKAKNPHSLEPDYGVPITKDNSHKGDTLSEARAALAGASSSTEVDKLTYQPFKDEFLPMAVNFNEALRKYALGAGTITAADYPLMTDTLVDTTVYDIVNRDFILLSAVTRKAWDKLVYTFDDRNPYRNTFGLGENDVSPSRSISYSTNTINLKKAQGHVSFSRWLDLAIRRRDIRGDNESIIDADFERGFVADMLVSLGVFTDNAVAGTWTAITAGDFFHTNDPYNDLYTDAVTIRTAGGDADTLICNSKTLHSMLSNSWMRPSGTSIISQGPEVRKPGTRQLTHSMLPGYTIFVEETIGTGIMFQLDKRGAVFLDGPRSTRVVEDNARNVVDTYSDRWYGSGLRVSTWGIEETGINA